MTDLILCVGMILLGQATSDVPAQNHDGNEPNPNILTVCEVLADPLKFNGRMVRLRGIVEGTNEGSWLTGECEKPLITDRHEWPNAIALVTPDVESRLHDVDFTWDRESFRRMHAEFHRLKANWVTHTVVATYTGLFETRDGLDFPTISGASGGPRKLGFGFGTGAPAQILIKSVSGPFVVVPRKNTKPATSHPRKAH